MKAMVEMSKFQYDCDEVKGNCYTNCPHMPGVFIGSHICQICKFNFKTTGNYVICTVDNKIIE